MPDYTKTRWYVMLDVFVKITTALAVVVLGTAGWLLQRNTTTTRESAENREREERKYLPMLNSLSELQLATAARSQVAYELQVPTKDTAPLLQRDGARMIYIADSLFLPDGEIQAQLTNAANFLTIGRLSRDTRLPLRYAVIMLGELMAICSSTHVTGETVIFYSEDGKGLFLTRPGNVAGRFDLPAFMKGDRRVATAVPALLKTDDRTTDGWTRWFPSTGVRADQACTVVLNGLNQDIGRSAGEHVLGVLAKHPDIAEKYVSVRTSLLRAGGSNP